MRRKGQLFLVEVIVSLSVLIILVSVLFSTQTFIQPPSNVNLADRGHNALKVLADSDILFTYLEQANYSYYTLNKVFFDELNETKLAVINTIESSLPAIANFKGYTERYNETLQTWERIDIINIESNVPSGTDITVVDYYTPGFHGTYAEFKIILYIWYEVSG